MTGQLAAESTIRLAFFLGVLLVMSAWEMVAPRRRREIPRLLRWSNNFAIVILDTLLVRMAFPIAAVGVAVLAQEHRWGFFNRLGAPMWVALVISVVVLDLVIYLQHLMFHALPALWRLHRVHHSDLECDVSTGVRFHPLEIVLSTTIKLAAVAALGAPALAVLVFEILLNATAMFNHSNVHLPPDVDRVLRRVLVTPDMHRVHHSIHPQETNSNFGFNLPWWDWLLGTYLAQPRDGHAAMTIGVGQFRTRRDLRIDRLLIQPFLSPAGASSIDGAGNE